jgi:hypothetical protein
MIDLVHHILRPRLPRLALAFVICLAVVAVVPQRAGAGLYTAAQCHPGYGAGHDDARFGRSSSDFAGAAGCTHGAGGLRITHAASRTLAGRQASWNFTAPPGTAFVHATVRAWGVAAGGLVPDVLAGDSGAMRSAGHAAGKPHRISWSGLARGLAARLECRRQPHCAPSDEARLGLNRVRLRISDPVKPAIGLTGPFADDRVVRGTQLLGGLADDSGAGVAGLSLEVNGHPAASRAVTCSLHGRIALRLSPCPHSAALALPENTASAPFRQGTNVVRVCARDYAARRDANVGCAARRLRVDNECPLAGVAGGVTLTAALRGVHRGFVASRRDHPRLAGRLLDASGNPVPGARVCVAAQPVARHSRERVLATPVTHADGRFAAAIPPGPGERLRAAYWPAQRGALQRFARIRFRARPRLRLRPRGALRIGDRLRFAVHLPGPDPQRRIVRIEAISHRHWVPVTGGRTGSGGTYRGSYRFHATRGLRTYRFRAVVPHQAGYPYAAGASPVREKRVRG